MIQRRFLLFFILLGSLGFCKEIAITIDDIPMGDGGIYKRKKRVELLLGHLKASNVRAAFYCIGQNALEPFGLECLELIHQNRHFLANHSFTHRSLSTLSIPEFIFEIDKTESILRSFSSQRKWFRFPYLDFGNREDRGGTPEKKEEAFEVLKKMGFIHGYITINTFDWHIDYRMQQALKKDIAIDYDKLRAIYLTLMMAWIEDFSAIWDAISEIEVAHVLLLHGNDLNALYLSDLLALLKQEGWTIVSPEKAYADPSLHYTALGDLYTQKFGVSYKNPSTLSTAYIDSVLDSCAIFK